RDADARGSKRPARAGSGHGRQLQADDGHLCVVGRGQSLGLRAGRLIPHGEEARGAVSNHEDLRPSFETALTRLLRMRNTPASPQMLLEKLRGAAPRELR